MSSPESWRRHGRRARSPPSKKLWRSVNQTCSCPPTRSTPAQAIIAVVGISKITGAAPAARRRAATGERSGHSPRWSPCPRRARLHRRSVSPIEPGDAALRLGQDETTRHEGEAGQVQFALWTAASLPPRERRSIARSWLPGSGTDPGPLPSPPLSAVARASTSRMTCQSLLPAPRKASNGMRRQSPRGLCSVLPEIIDEVAPLHDE